MTRFQSYMTIKPDDQNIDSTKHNIILRKKKEFRNALILLDFDQITTFTHSQSY